MRTAVGSMRHAHRARSGGGRRMALAASAAAVVVTLLTGAGVASANALTPASSPAAAATGKTWYVDCGAKKQGSGSEAKPWHSFGPVDAHHFAPGDRLLLKRGTTCSGELDPKGSGSYGHPIVLGAYGKGTRPTVAGHGTPNLTGAVELRNQHDWTVQDLHITNTTTSKAPKSYRSGILLLNTGVGRLRRMTVQRVAIDHVSSDPVSSKKVGARGYGGISVLTRAGVESGFDSLQILNNTISYVGRSGIVESNHEYSHSWDQSPRIAHNVVSWSRGDSIIMTGVMHGRMDHNRSAHGAALWPCSQCKGLSPETADSGMYTAKSRYVQIDHNEVYGVHSRGGDGEAIDADVSARDVTIEDDYLHDNQGGGVLVCGATDVTIRFDIMQNNARSALTFTCRQKTSSVQIYDNTIYAKKAPDTDYVVRTDYPKSSKVSFTNNLVYSYGPSRYQWPLHTKTAANTFVGTHSSTEPRGAKNSRANPGLKSPGHGAVGVSSLKGYHLKSTKKAQTGVAIAATASTDFFGHAVAVKKPFRGASSTTK